MSFGEDGYFTNFKPVRYIKSKSESESESSDDEKYTACIKSVATLKEKCKATNKDLRVLEKSLDDFKDLTQAEEHDIRDAIHDLQNQCETLENANKTMNKEFSELEESYDALEEDTKSNSKSITVLQKENRLRLKSIKELQEENKILKESNVSLLQLVDVLKESNVSLLQSVDILKEESKINSLLIEEIRDTLHTDKRKRKRKEKDNDIDNTHKIQRIVNNDKETNDIIIDKLNNNTDEEKETDEPDSKEDSKEDIKIRRPRKEMEGFTWHERIKTHTYFKCNQCKDIIDMRAIKTHICKQ